MGTHPINLALRFLLEICALVAIGQWSYRLTPSAWKMAWVILIPLAIALIWGVFNVPGDPSRSGAAPVIVPGLIRLLLEWAVFAFACWALFQTGHTRWSLILATLVVLHYLISYDRIAWLLSQE